MTDTQDRTAQTQEQADEALQRFADGFSCMEFQRRPQPMLGWFAQYMS
jgi:hypothetical protein